MAAREKALREMMELEQRAKELEATKARQISELETAQQELERTKRTADTARKEMERAKIDHGIQQEAQRKVQDASERAAGRIQLEREYTMHARQKRCAAYKHRSVLRVQHMLAFAIRVHSTCFCMHVDLLNRSDKARSALEEARQKAWAREADRFETKLASVGQSHGPVRDILDSLVGAGQAGVAMAADSIHAAADEVTATLAHSQPQPATRAIDRTRRPSLFGVRRR